MISGILFGSFLLFLILGLPIAVSLGVSSLIVLLVTKAPPLLFMYQTLIYSVDSFPLMAVPFFMLIGTVMSGGGIAKRIMRLTRLTVGRMMGGLGIATLISCAIFAAISGSGPATTAAIGGLFIPIMIKSNYKPSFAGAVAASGGALGALIPPSIAMIVYGVVSGTSITALFLGGMIPGVITALLLSATTYVMCKKKGYHLDEKQEEVINKKEIWSALKSAFPALLMPIIVLGGIYSGIFTPSEAGAVAIVYGVLVELFIYKEIKLKELFQRFCNAGVIASTVLFIVSVATIYGRILTIEQIPQQISMIIAGVSSNPTILLLIVSAFLIFVGMFMDNAATIILLTPILLPVLKQAGVDPLVFGVIFAVEAEIGFLTPPLGYNLFVAADVAKVKLEEVVGSVMPLLLVFILFLLILILFPQLITFLPNLIYK